MSYIAGRKTTFDYAHVLEEHAHSAGCVYPTLVAGIDVLAGAAGPPWVLGEFVEIVPVDTITEAYDIHWLVLETVSDDDVYELVFYEDETEVSRVRFAVEAGVGGTVTFSPIPTLMPILAANSKLQVKLACATGTKTITMSVIYHTY